MTTTPSAIHPVFSDIFAQHFGIVEIEDAAEVEHDEEAS